MINIVLTVCAINALIGVITELYYYNFKSNEYEKLIRGFGPLEVIIPSILGVLWLLIRIVDAYKNWYDHSSF